MKHRLAAMKPRIAENVMATRPEDFYQPITVPPGGLLASTVGPPTAPLPPINPNEYENDDVVAEITLMVRL